MSDKSHVLAREKLKKDIMILIQSIDPTQGKNITFDSLGKILQGIELFKINYNPIYENKIKDTGVAYERLEREKEFHNNCWGLFANPNKKSMNINILTELLVLFYDSVSIPIKEVAFVASSTSHNINNYNRIVCKISSRKQKKRKR